MDRKQLDKHIAEIYGVAAEFPWLSAPTFGVYRHQSNNKWFAVIMEIPKNKLGIEDEGSVNVVNLKSDPLLIGSLLLDEGIHTQRGEKSGRAVGGQNVVGSCVVVTQCFGTVASHENGACILNPIQIIEGVIHQ